MLGWIAALLVGSPAPTITMTVRADTVAHVVERIAQESGLALGTRAPILHHILLIDVEDVPVEELLAKIALATAGTWIQEKDRRVLTRPADLNALLERSERDQRAREFDELLARKQQAVRPWSPERSRQLVEAVLREEAKWASTQDPTADEALRRLRQELPFQSALIQLLTQIGGETLADIGDNERVVFSNRPNARQVRLPPSCDSVLDALKLQIGDLQSEIRRRSAERSSSFGLTSLGPEGTSGARVLLCVTNFSASLKIEGDWSDRARLSLTAEQPTLPQTTSREEPFEVSEAGAWIASYWKARATQKTPPQATGAVREMLLSPARHPRAGALVFDALKGLAREEGRQLVAWIPTVGVLRLEVRISPRLTLAGAEAELTAQRYRLDRPNGWLMVTPMPAYMEATEGPLEPVERYVRRVEAEGAVRLLDLATLMSQTGQLRVPYEPQMLGYGSPGIVATPLLPLLGSLTPSQRGAAFSPQGIALSQLAPPQWALVESAVYQEDSWPWDPFEVTEAFPSGVPRGGSFRVQVETMEFARPWLESAQDQESPTLNAERLASQIMNRQDGRRVANEPWEAADRYQYGRQARYTLTLNLGERGSQRREASEPTQFQLKPTRWQEFPEAFRTLIERILKDRN